MPFGMASDAENVRPFSLPVSSAGRNYKALKTTMPTIENVPACNLSKEAIGSIERLFYKNSDDIALSVARALERLEERIEAAESRLYSRFADLEDKLAEVEAGFVARDGRNARPRRAKEQQP